jgi:hypothetical protein
MMSELYRDFIDRKADEIITDLGGTITPAPTNTELYRDFLGRKFDDVITAIINMNTGGVLSGDTAPNNADGDNNDLYVQYDSSYNVVALYVKLNDIWRSISTTGSTHTYSTTEQVIGTWIDGKPIYEISFILTSPSYNTSTNVVDVTNFHIDTLISLEGTINTSTNAVATGNSELRLWIRKNFESTLTDYIACFISFAGYSNEPFVITMRYTKN